jgi:hypothetical protein
LGPDGNYTQVHPQQGEPLIDAQVVWMERARQGLFGDGGDGMNQALTERLEHRF